MYLNTVIHTHLHTHTGRQTPTISYLSAESISYTFSYQDNMGCRLHGVIWARGEGEASREDHEKGEGNEESGV